MTKYKEVIQTAIDREKQILGDEMAFSVVESVEGIQIDDEGEIQYIKRDNKEVLDDLVAGFCRVSGDIAESIIARAITDLNTDNLDLPKRLADKV